LIEKAPDSNSATANLGNRPLYAQVRELLLARISSGAWRPGELIPNEFAIARELGVSQGTVRKALDSLAAGHLLVRRQGRGTYVAEHTPANMLFRFFNFCDSAGQRVEPDSRLISICEARAAAAERARLMLAPAAKVIRISRLRMIGEQPFILEQIVVPLALFPGLAEEAVIPNTLYDHFQKGYGVTVARGSESLTAAVADAEQAGRLGIAEGAPLLRLDRTMYELRQQPVEWRISYCRTDAANYVVELR
jgi:GntR family transcriptional regulator